MRGGLSPRAGSTAFIAALALMASQSLRQLANLQAVFAEGMSAARRLFAALDVEPEVREQPGAPDLPRGKGQIAFEAVSFAYDDGGPTSSERQLRRWPPRRDRRPGGPLRRRQDDHPQPDPPLL